MAIVTSNSSLYPPVVNNAVTVMAENNDDRTIRIFVCISTLKDKTKLEAI